MRVLLAQLEPEPGDPAANAARAAGAVAERPEVELAVFPELFVSGYRTSDVDEVACRADEPVLASLADAAADSETAIVVGFAERADGGLFNAVACIDSSGELVGTYRKTHLFGAEADAYMPGDSLFVVPLAGRRLAPQICFDMEFPEPAREVARAGADLLVTASANMEPFRRDHEIACRARALENRLPHVYVNRSGSEGGLRFTGCSRVVDADGGITAEAGEAEELVVADVGSAGAEDERVDYLAHSRGELPVHVAGKDRQPGGVG